MKHSLFIILFLAFSIMESSAQEKKLAMPYDSDLKYMNPMPPYVRDVSEITVIDSGTVRVLYALNATDIKNLETYDDLQRLEIGAQYSKYYSFFVFKKDSTVSARAKESRNKNG